MVASGTKVDSRDEAPPNTEEFAGEFDDLIEGEVVDEEEVIDFDAVVEEELAEEEPETQKIRGYESNVVTLAARDFTIEEPTIGIVVRIIKCFGGIAVRGERAALRQLQSLSKSPTLSNRVVMFGMLSAFSVEDLVALGSAVLQFADDRQGRKWLRSVKLELSPIVRAFFLNVHQSRDLRDTIESFFGGLEMTEGFLTSLNL